MSTLYLRMAQRPPPNLLDLRQIMADRETVPTRRRFQRGPRLTRPAKRPRDWRGLRRETLKFVVAVLAVIAVWVVGRGLWQVWQQAHRAEGLARDAWVDIQTAGQALADKHPDQAQTSFAQAAALSQRAATQLDQLDGLHGQIVGHVPWLGHKFSAGQHVAKALGYIAQAGVTVSTYLTPEVLNQPGIQIDTTGVVTGSIGYLPPLIDHYSAWQSVIHESLAAVNELSYVRSQDVPTGDRAAFQVLDRVRPLISGQSNRLDPIVTVLTELLASPEPKDELIIMQNNDELRATGGFAGTYMLVQFSRGTFKILDAPGNGPYALTQQIPQTILPPQPLLALNPFWAFQDTNWFLDVPTSAATTLDFYQQARGFKPDGVIYLNPQLMESLLKITGPIRPQNYHVDITADNFVRATEQQVEFGYDKAVNNPKQFIIDLVPAMIEKMKTLPPGEGLRAALTAMAEADQQNLMIYSRSQALQSAVKQLGWDGAVPTVTGDSLAIVDTNLGGGKTDRIIRTDVKVQVVDDGSELQHTVSLVRHHAGKKNDALTGFINKDFIRVYAPSNAQFVSISGSTVPDAKFFFTPSAGATTPASVAKAEGQTLIDPQNGTRITHESGRTVFGAWSVVEPGEDQTVVFTYTTPRPTGNSWSLYWQHQPGAPTRDWRLSYQTANGHSIQSAPSGKVQGRTVTWSTTSDTNQLFEASY